MFSMGRFLMQGINLRLIVGGHGSRSEGLGCNATDHSQDL